MRWEDERYVRIFTRDTPSWDAMGWEAQALLMLIFRKMDRTGLLALGSSGMRGLAACVRMPADVVARALQVLLEDGVLSWSGPDLFCKNFLEAQECSKSDSLRSREKRERAQLKLTQSVSPPTQSVSQVTQVDQTCHTVTLGDTPSVPSDPVPSVPSLNTHGGCVVESPKQAKAESDIRAVFAHYQTKRPKSFPKIHSGLKEWKLIRERIVTDGRTAADLCKCIDGYWSSQWHQGHNDRKTKYLDLELFMRDEAHVAKGIELADGTSTPAPTSVLPPNRFEIVRAIERQRLGEDRRQPTLGLLDEVNHGNR